MSGHLKFWIVTRDRDFTDTAAYPGIAPDSWNRLGPAHVYYASPDRFKHALLKNLIAEVEPDVIYLNSFFSPLAIRFLFWRQLHRLPRTSVILAPRGEFSPGALGLKRWKKRLCLALARICGLFDTVIWQASSRLEERDIRAQWREPDAVVAGKHVHVAPDLAHINWSYRDLSLLSDATKDVGTARFVFLSRIAPKKNLHTALDLLRQLSGNVTFDIYGPIDDADYWRACQHTTSALPANIRVTYRGAVPNEQVPGILASYHFLLFPTLGENFGHVIFESLAAGCPVVISDQTPWSDLSKQGIGWDLPLWDHQQWHDVLRQCVAMPDREYRGMNRSARQFAAARSTSSAAIARNIALFQHALGSACSRRCVAGDSGVSIEDGHLALTDCGVGDPWTNRRS